MKYTSNDHPFFNNFQVKSKKKPDKRVKISLPGQGASRPAGGQGMGEGRA
jgi:hypothetical protein